VRAAAITPTDLRTRDGTEYLIARYAAGQALHLRLDRIQAATPLPNG
jgi:transcriptional antiterminator Rof (Rho-off)